MRLISLFRYFFKRSYKFSFHDDNVMARSQGEGDLKDFWQEFKDIESSKVHDEEEEITKTPDGM